MEVTTTTSQQLSDAPVPMRILDWQPKSFTDLNVQEPSESTNWKLWVRQFARQLPRLALQVGLTAFIASILIVVFYRFVPVPFTPLMIIRAGEQIADGRFPKLSKDWVSLDEMSPRLQFAVLAAEDTRFFEHNGFDWEAIAKAMKHNKRSQKIRGGSTISQQVAKNVFLWPSRSWVRKGLETYFTALIEFIWPKDRIMEVYLNVVELGDGIYGVEAASQQYFKKSARKLNAPESALMAAVLPNPIRFKVAKPSRYVRFRQTMIQRRMPAAARMVPKSPAKK